MLCSAQCLPSQIHGDRRPQITHGNGLQKPVCQAVCMVDPSTALDPALPCPCHSSESKASAAGTHRARRIRSSASEKMDLHRNPSPWVPRCCSSTRTASSNTACKHEGLQASPLRHGDCRWRMLLARGSPKKGHSLWTVADLMRKRSLRAAWLRFKDTLDSRLVEVRRQVMQVWRLALDRPSRGLTLIVAVPPP